MNLGLRNRTKEYMTLEQYIDQINKRYQLGNATEHTFRGDLQQLIETLVPTIMATNEPKRQSCGAPDYILTKKDKSDKNSSVPVGYIEAKDIGDGDMLGEKKSGNKEQFDRYKASLSNIIFTDYLTFHFYQNAKLIKSISIATIEKNKIIAQPQHFAEFTLYIQNFCTFVSQTITQSQVLATLMATKSRLFANAIEQAIQQDIDQEQNTQLTGIYKAFQVALIQDIDVKQFSDLFAQTVTYGFFAARYRDYTLQDFSREEASRLIPLSNPFLRKLFLFISSIDLDERILWIVEDLVSIFLACNLRDILKTYGKSTKMENPIIHFYEDFLAEYDPKLRKARGVWYTPQPVVNFIVRAVDDVLKTEFDLPQGLADTSKTKITTPNPSKGGEKTREVHKVQILDPATGTGTFLAEVVKHIHKKFEGQKGIWNSYVEQHLIPRLNGFELLMASYAMAHLQMDILLSELSSPNPEEIEMRKSEQRFNIFLTNSLEAPKLEQPDLFTAPFITDEALQADKVKRDTPVMCIIGNPPYSGISSNNGKWISDLIEDYKYVDGVHFNERKHWLNDDYVKFLRYGQHFIEKNGSGVLAYINPHGFLDNPTFRGMRWHLLKTFDKIYTIDLHGNSKKKETAPDGSADINVFDIQQGVSINIFVKTGKKKANELGKVFHYDLFGKREMKYDFLSENSLKTIDFTELQPNHPNYFFVPKNDEGQGEYETGFRLDELFAKNNVGFVSANDGLNVSMTEQEQRNKINDILELDENQWRIKYNRPNDAQSWKYKWAKEDAEKNQTNKLIEVSYRPFDKRLSLYTGKSGGLYARPSYDIMQHFLKGENVGLVTARQCVGEWQYVFCTKLINEFNLTGTAGRFGSGNTFPLYLYPDSKNQDLFADGQERTPNLNTEIVKEIAERLGLAFVSEKTPPNLPKGEEQNAAPLEGAGEVKKEGLLQPGYITANPKNYLLIKEMRDSLKNNPTDAEKLIWEYLRNKKTGHKIRRQHIIDDFITDFVCLSKKVVIEIDGKIHLNQKEYDVLRTLRLNELGYDVIRFTNEEVFANPQFVFSRIKENLDSKSDQQSDEDAISPPLEGQGEVDLKVLGEVFAPIDILDYIYAVLHSPSYREKYKEFLKIDFPRVPYPKDKNTFWQLVKLGREIREIHLLESATVEKYITQYSIDGDNVVTKPRYIPSPPLEGWSKTGVVGKVYINDTQYFDNVPEVAWNFYIGGYQPAQKWLKDRKDRKLEYEDILHYQKIIVALTETDRIMREIDEVEI
jgi:very-short-patch-repair endonuclease